MNRSFEIRWSLMLALLSFFCLTLTSCKKDESIPRANELDALALRITEKLPANWGVEKSGNQIIVSRKEPIMTHGCLGLDGSWARHPERLREFVEKSGVTRPYKIRLRFGPKLGFAEYYRADFQLDGPIGRLVE